MIFDAPGSYIRDAIRGLRQNGNPVGSGYKGYFWAETADELMATLLHLRDRASSELRTVRALTTAFGTDTQITLALP
jgi:hypothetical protein